MSTIIRVLDSNNGLVDTFKLHSNKSVKALQEMLEYQHYPKGMKFIIGETNGILNQLEYRNDAS
jgi:hypothetical protein